MKVLFISLAFCITGCAHNSGLDIAGDQTYIVYREAKSNLITMESLKKDTLDIAAEQCKVINQYVPVTKVNVHVVKTVDNAPPYLQGYVPNTELHYKCLSS
jgi:hypothetical protein